jgi:glycosyltransferase-like protein
MSAPRIAILAHSTIPRGGPVHALELDDALTRLGYQATVFAPDATGSGFFRDTLCATSCVAATPAGNDRQATVETWIDDYIRHFEHTENRQFDVWHAQSESSGNALATLKERGLIGGFGFTVHHILGDERLRRLQLRAITSADHLFVVGRVWQDWVARELKRDACYVGNGVDRTRFSPRPDETDSELRTLLTLPAGVPLFLALGGIEWRKNTIQVLRAFKFVQAQNPSARLVIAGGAAIVENEAFKARFAEVFAHSGALASAVILTGPLPQKLMPALYRAATSLVFPSIREGFGLVVLEAMASGTPVVTSRIAPFTEYLDEDDVLWCDPLNAASIAEAMSQSLDATRRHSLIARGMRVAARHDWIETARAHLPIYEKLRTLATAAA